MKKIKRIIILILLTLTITGCVKMEISMDINKDKSMNLGIIQAVDKSLLEGADSSSLMDEEEIKKLEDEGFKVEEYTESNMTGYKITKEVKNIDEISTENDITADLGTSALADSEYMFTVKKGLFKNTYKAVLKNSDTDELDESLNSGLTDDTTDDEYLEDDFIYDEDYTYDDTTNYTDDYLTDEDYYDTTEDDYTNSGIKDFDYTTLLSSMELKMKVNLPYKALSNNATLVENDGTTLTWDLMNFEKDAIEFEFEIYNTTNIIIIAVSGILVIVLLIVLIIKKLSKKNKNNVVASTNNETMPNTNEAQPINNATLDQTQQPQNQVSPEQPLPNSPVETNQMTTHQEQQINNTIPNNNIDLINIPNQPQVENIINPISEQQPITNSVVLNENNTEMTNPGFITSDQNTLTSFKLVNETENQLTNNIVQPNNNILESQSVIPQVPLTPPTPELNNQLTNNVNVVEETTNPNFVTPDKNLMTSFNMINEAANQSTNNIIQPNNNILELQSEIPQVPLTPPAPELNNHPTNNVNVVQEMPQPISLDTINNGQNQSQPYDIFSMNNEQPLPTDNMQQPSQYNSILADQNTNK